MTNTGSERAGYWGSRTSSNDFCESNYVVSYYVAEWWNFLTSFVILAYGIFGVYKAVKYGYHRRFILMSSAIAFVGFGSAAFHGTLLRVGQMMDELPMIYATLVFAYSVLELYSPSGRSKYPWAIPALVSYAVVFTILYLYFEKLFFFFIISYFICCAALLSRALMLINEAGVPKISKYLALTSVFVYPGIFFFLWLPEHFYCDRIGWIYPHAIFHIFSGVAVHAFCVFVAFETHRRQFLEDRKKLSPKQVDDDIDVHESHMTVRFYRVAGVPIVPYVHLEDVKTE